MLSLNCFSLLLKKQSVLLKWLLLSINYLTEITLSTNELRDTLNDFYADKARDLATELSSQGYSCTFLYLPYPVLRVNHADSELDIALHAAYVDILGEAVPYSDAANRISHLLYLCNPQIT